MYILTSSVTSFAMTTLELDTIPSLSWENFLWHHFPNTTQSQRAGSKRKWVWKHGYDIEYGISHKRRWVCYYCQLKLAPTPLYSCAEEGLQNAVSHLWLEHKIWDDAETTAKPTKKGWRGRRELGSRNIAERMGLNTQNAREQQIANNLIHAFDKATFQQKLLSAIIVDNLPFRIAEFKLLR